MPDDPVTSIQPRSGFLPRRFGRLIAPGLLAAGLIAQAQPAPPPLTTVTEVRRLSVAQAALQPRVRLRAVVTFFDEPLYSRFVQDEAAGIYLQASTNTRPLFPGQLVEIEGRVIPGEYSPAILPEQVRVVGTSAMPRPKPVTFEDLARGNGDCQFVEINGIVRSVQFHEVSQHYVVRIASGSGRLSVYTRQLPVPRAGDLPDSSVRVRGVSSAEFNHQRQLFAVRLMVPRAEDFIVETPAPANPFAVPASPIESLLRFPPKEPYGHRDKVAGTVIYFEPGKMLVLQDGHQGVEVQTQSRAPLATGDRVEALGFVSRGIYTPVLEDAVYRKIPGTPAIQPARLTPDDVLKGKHDCQLIQVEARLLDQAEHGEERYLVFQAGGSIFNAHFSKAKDRGKFFDLKNGSRALVTGVCRIDPGEWAAGVDWRARSFRMDLRSFADVRVLQQPPWWTPQRVLWLVAAALALAAGGFSWVVVLRRQVAERSRQLEIQIGERQRAERRREIEQERTRVAHDLHDELGATLTEVAMLGTLAQTSELSAAERGKYLEKLTTTSRAMVANLDEIVWAVNPKYDSASSLATYFSLFAQRFLNLAGMACRLQVAETFPAVPVEAHRRHGVFLAFKEALHNAVRHSGATQVLVGMEVAGNQLKIIVQDNGRGFTAAEPLPGSDGLTGMTERMTRLGGRCEITSRTNEGTTVEFWLPLGEPHS